MKRLLLICASILTLVFGATIPAHAVGVGGLCVKGEVKIHYATSGLPTQWITTTTGYIPVAPPDSIFKFIGAGTWATWLGYQFWTDYNVQIKGGATYGFRWYGVNNGASPTHSVTSAGHTCSWYGDTFSQQNGTLVGGLVIVTST